MRNVSRFILMLPVVFGLSGCAIYKLEELNHAEPSGSPFQKALATEYRSVSEREQKRYNWWHAVFFADKSLTAAYGNDIVPESVEELDITPNAMLDLQTAHVQLLSVLTDDNKANRPQLLAEAQVAFDRWVVEYKKKESGWLVEDSFDAHEKFQELILQLLPHPEPVKAEAAKSAKPKTKPKAKAPVVKKEAKPVAKAEPKPEPKPEPEVKAVPSQWMEPAKEEAAPVKAEPVAMPEPAKAPEPVKAAEPVKMPEPVSEMPKEEPKPAADMVKPEAAVPPQAAAPAPAPVPVAAETPRMEEVSPQSAAPAPATPEPPAAQPQAFAPPPAGAAAPEPLAAAIAAAPMAGEAKKDDAAGETASYIVFFEPGKSMLTDLARKTLDTAAKSVLPLASYQIVVNTSTDKSATAADPAMLGERLGAIKKHLMDAGVAESAIESAGASKAAADVKRKVEIFVSE